MQSGKCSEFVYNGLMTGKRADVRILHLLKGADQVRGTAVVIDVFRAFTVEGFLLAGDAGKVIPVADAGEALEMQDVIRIGERHGKKLPGFDFGNSPSEIAAADFRGKTVVHTTSAGTQGIHACLPYADEVLAAALTNASATAEYLKRSGAEHVSLLCMGLMGESDSEEDTLCAEYIAALLNDEDPSDILARVPLLKETAGRKFFDPAQDWFPEADFALCTDTDRFGFAMKVVRDGDRLTTVRIDL